MKKYLMAFLVCFAIFVLWILFQVFVAKGVLVGVLFCLAMFGAWKMIVKRDDKKANEEETETQKIISKYYYYDKKGNTVWVLPNARIEYVGMDGNLMEVFNSKGDFVERLTVEEHEKRKAEYKRQREESDNK